MAQPLRTSPWMKEMQNRYSISLSQNGFQSFNASGQLTSPAGKVYWFHDGCLRFSNDGSQMTVFAHNPRSDALVLIQIDGMVVAEMKLSHDMGVLVRHVRRPGNRVPEEYRGNAIALLNWPKIRIGPNVFGYAEATIRSGIMNSESGNISVKIASDGLPRLNVTERFCVMFAHRRYQNNRAQQNMSLPAGAEDQLVRTAVTHEHFDPVRSPSLLAFRIVNDLYDPDTPRLEEVVDQNTLDENAATALEPVAEPGSQTHDDAIDRKEQKVQDSEQDAQNNKLHVEEIMHEIVKEQNIEEHNMMDTAAQAWKQQALVLWAPPRFTHNN